MEVFGFFLALILAVYIVVEKARAGKLKTDIAIFFLALGGVYVYHTLVPSHLDVVTMLWIICFALGLFSVYVTLRLIFAIIHRLER